MKRNLLKFMAVTSAGLALSISLNTAARVLAQQPAVQPAQAPVVQPTSQPAAAQPTALINDPRGLLNAFGAMLSNPTLIQGFLDQLADNVQWNVIGDSSRLLFPGQYQGRDAVQTHIQNSTRNIIWTAEEFTPLDILVEQRTSSKTGAKERRVAARVAQSGKGAFTGRSFRGDFVYLFTMDAAGRIQSFNEYYNSYPVAAAATGVAAPIMPGNDRLTGQAATVDPQVNPETAKKAAIAAWKALIAGDLPQVAKMSTPNSRWSFAIGGPKSLPYVNAAEGMTSDGQPLKADLSNAGPIVQTILLPKESVLKSGKLVIQETIANGNRVLVRLRETGAIARETGNRYDLDILSWMTIDRDGKIESNEIIVDTYQTVMALRPGAMFPLPESPLKVRHFPPFFVTGSRVNEMIVTFDEQGNYTGVLGQANSTDTRLQQPSALTYGADGNLYTTSSNTTDRTLGNEVLVYDGVSGQFRGGFGQANNAQSGLLNPTGIKFGLDGNLYVANGYNSQVLRYNGKTGAFMGVYATRNNGYPNNLVPADLPVSDFTVLVFGPDGDLYVTSLLENNMQGAVLRYAGPRSAKPGAFRGIYGQATSTRSELNQPRSIVFGPDANLYVASAATGRILRYAGPLRKDAGMFMGVYADILREVIAQMGVTSNDLNGDGIPDQVIQNGLGFGIDGNLYVSSSIQAGVAAGQPPASPTGGSQIRDYAGPHRMNAGQFLSVFGQADTEGSRLLLPTTPEFVHHDNSFPAVRRFNQIYFVVGCNTDRPTAANGTAGFFQSDTTDAIAAYDKNMKFIGFLNQDLLGSKNPVNGVGGITVAPNGHILVSSQLSNQVLQFNSLTGKYMGVFGDASPRGTGDNPSTSANEGLNFPAGLTIGPDNNLYVTDLGNKRVLKFDGYTGKFLGSVIQFNTAEAFRFTDLVFGPDGRIYIGFNPPLEQPALGVAEVRVYRPDGVLETTIKGTPERPLDFAAALDVGPDNRLYIGDDPASVVNTANGQLLAPDRESRLLIYDIPNVYPLFRNSQTDLGDPSGNRQQPRLVKEFQIGLGNAGGLTVDTDGTIYISEPYAGQVAKYNANGELLGTVPNFRLPSAALTQNGGVDADGRPRPTGSVFIKPMQ
ncbi:MAG: hypothetical protein WCA35_08435 [Kovacikia sp.]